MVGEPLVGDFLFLCGIVGAISLMVLLGLHVAEIRVGPPGRHGSSPSTLRQTLLEWLAYMLLYSSLAALLEGILHLV